MHLIYEKGIKSLRIDYPDSRLAKWQLLARAHQGRWVVAQNGVLWVKKDDLSMRRMRDDGSHVESFSISPDGNGIAWTTKKGQVYVSNTGNKPLLLGYGRDPTWHPKKPLVLYAAGRMIGRVAKSYDLRLVNNQGKGRFLTKTQFSSERWPQWTQNGQRVIYTKAKTSDIFVLDL